MVQLAEMLFLMAAGFFIVIAALFVFALLVDLAFWSWSHITVVLLLVCIFGIAKHLRQTHVEI